MTKTHFRNILAALCKRQKRFSLMMTEIGPSFEVKFFMMELPMGIQN